MSTHLTPAEVVSVAEGHGREVLLRHVEVCAVCRAEVDVVRAVEIDLRANAAVPEPSPLFWDHFSRRVREATAHEPVPLVSWWPGRWATGLAAGAAVVVLAVTLSIQLSRGVVGPSRSDEASPDASPATLASDDGRWDDMVHMAAQLPSDQMSDLVAIAETTSLVDDLTSEERRTLLRLISMEMKDAQ